MSWPKLRCANSSLLTLENVTGVFVVTRIAETKTSSSWLTLVVSFCFSCEKETKENRKKRIEKRRKKLEFCAFAPLQLKIIVFIRK